MIVCNTNAVTRTFAHKGSTPYLPYTYITALMLSLKKTHLKCLLTFCFKHMKIGFEFVIYVHKMYWALKGQLLSNYVRYHEIYKTMVFNPSIT